MPTIDKGKNKRGTDYRSTMTACCAGYFVQAVNINLLAVIFIPLREQFGLSYTQFGTLVFVIFVTQVSVNVVFGKIADMIGMRPLLLPALGCCAAGLIFFALVPVLFPAQIFGGFLAANLLFAAGGGVLELCLSPIVDSIPSDASDSSKSLSFLHSFYAWGQVSVVLITTALIYAGVPWQAVVLFWALVPVADALLFMRAPITERPIGDAATPIRALLRTKVFVVAVVAIACAGAVETNIAQYASSFMERGLGLPKLIGDILGLCGFALLLGAGRLIYGLLGERIEIHAVLIGGSALSLAAYLVIVFSPAIAPAVVAIALCGLFVSLLWPGTLAIASKRLPNAGASLFALLSAAGSLGCSVGPWIYGVVTDFSMKRIPAAVALSAEQFGLRAGLLVAAVFPIASLAVQAILKRQKMK